VKQNTYNLRTKQSRDNDSAERKINRSEQLKECYAKLNRIDKLLCQLEHKNDDVMIVESANARNDELEHDDNESTTSIDSFWTLKKLTKVQQRRESARIRMQNKRESETNEENAIRLEKMRKNAAALRSNESRYQTRYQLEKKRQNTAASISNETPEQNREQFKKTNKVTCEKKLFVLKAAFTKPGDPPPAPYHPGLLKDPKYACKFCKAYHFPKESHKCCEKRKIELQSFGENYPEQLKNMLTDPKQKFHKLLRENIRSLNAMIAPMSRKVNMVNIQPGSTYYYKIQGQTDYYIGSLMPKD
jgi:hypothetical protein